MAALAAHVPDLSLVHLDRVPVLCFGATDSVQVGPGWQAQVRALVRPEVQDQGVPFSGGVVGFLGYEAGRFCERMPDPRPGASLGDGMFRRYPGALQRVDGQWLLAGDPDWVAAAQEVIHQALQSPIPPPRRPELLHAPADSEYLAGVQDILECIAAGEHYQVNLARRLELAATDTPQSLLLALLQDHPMAPHGAFLQGPKGTLISDSPELFWRLQAGQVHARPIKGTAPLGQAAALEQDPKERAELTMIVDLMRNDLGRVCVPGSIQVSPRRILELPTLLHAEQQVHGRLAPGMDALDLMDASFPPASITGAPKVQAMATIAELEPVPRGAYTGAIGAFLDGGDAEFSVAIRVLQCLRHTTLLHVGCGIVSDSVPASEVRETWLKARSWLGEGAGR